jgi:hypothetical protein
MTKRLVACLFTAACAAGILLGCTADRMSDNAVATDSAVAVKGGEAAAAPEVRTPHQYVYVAYLNPADREPMPGYEKRLDGAITTIQEWYRREMESNGFGRITFPLERDKDGKLIVHLVQGTITYEWEKKVSTGVVRDEQVRPALIKEGIDIDQEHVIIVQNAVHFVEEKGETLLKAWAPYCGSGDYKHGTAWVHDSDHLELSRMPAGGIGGIAHELGHAFGLPHNMETTETSKTHGIALMGNGHPSFLAERMGKKGAFLTRGHAIVLSSHPLFKGNAKDIDAEAECCFLDIEFAQGEDEYIVRGRVEASPAAYAVLAYHDDMAVPMDYEATSWVADFKDGQFEVHVGDLEPGPFELRLRCYMVNGDKRQVEFQFEIDESCRIPIDGLKRQALYELCVKPPIVERDPKALLAEIEKLSDLNDINYRRARAYYQLMTRTKPEPVELAALPESVRQVPLSYVKWVSAEVGWSEVTRDAVPVEDDEGKRNDWPLESGVQFHETGLYAHALSSFVYNLEGNWKRLTSGYGLQNINKGSVVFVIKCDGEERFRSELVEDWVEGWVDIDLTGVKQLELIVEDGGNGGWGDCGIWFSPILTR